MAQQTSDKIPRWIPAALFVLAAAVQIATIATVGRTRPWGDEREYVAVAERVVAGDGLVTGAGNFYVHNHPPLYPLFLAAIFRLGGGAFAAQLIQAALVLATLGLVYYAARKQWGERAAAWGLALGAGYLLGAFYATRLLADTPLIFALAAALVLVGDDRAGAKRWGVAGAVLGLAALLRSLAFPIALAWAAWALAAPGAPVARRLARAGALVVGLAAVLVPWSAYVYRHTGHVVLTDANGPLVLYLGNHERTPYHRSWDVYHDDILVAPSRYFTAGGENGFRAGALCRDAALRYIAAHPLATAARIGGRVLDLLEPDRTLAGSYVMGRAPGLARWWALPVLVLYAVDGVATLALALVGLVLLPRGPYRTALGLAAGVIVAVHGLTLAQPRYVMPIVTLAFGAAGYAVAGGIGAAVRGKAGRGRTVAAAFVMLLIALALGRAVYFFGWRP